MNRSGPLSVVVPFGYRVGRWEVLHPLASGAFSSVYAARDTEGPEAAGGTVQAERTAGAQSSVEAEGIRAAGHTVPATAALKFVATGTHTPRQLRHLQELSEREQRLHRKLRHPRLVRMYEAHTVDDADRPELDGCSVLVFEQAESSLDALLHLKNLVSPGGALPGAGRILAHVSEGLAHLHAAGWVHGDLKPGNVLLFDGGDARLADFNLAAELEGTHAYAPAFSTLDYTPPELFWPETGARGIHVRQTADVWAFGVLACLLLTGAPPFPGGTPSLRRDAVLRYVSGNAPLSLSSRLPHVWRELIADCLAPTHEARAQHTSASLVARVASAAEPGRDAEAPRAGPDDEPDSRNRPPKRGRRTTLVGTLALLCGLGLGIGWSLLQPPAKNSGYGYARCPAGHVCFFSEENGNGDICRYRKNDSDWPKNGHCAWTRSRPIASLFNNGDEDNPYYKVEFYLRPHYEQRVGCTSINQQGNLAGTYRVGSHRWVRDC